MPVRLKIDLHTHSAEDCSEVVSGHTDLIPAFKFIDLAVAKGYDAISFTHHGMLYQDRDVLRYAQKKGLLLIPGVEAFIERRHVLLINFTQKKYITTFEDLRACKHDNMLVIAPHPYYSAGISLGHYLERNIDLFDAIEYCHFYYGPLNFNRKAVRIAKKYGVPLVGNSDTHHPMQFGTTFSYVHAEERSIPAIIQAIKQGQVQYVSYPLSLPQFISETFWILQKLPYEIRMHLRRRVYRASRKVLHRVVNLRNQFGRNGNR
ncbi:PHP domain-containing protein [candidate division KSB1 bacterium]|nr:PHP domain-containing protein [candidate division KSB1 bacterium]